MTSPLIQDERDVRLLSAAIAEEAQKAGLIRDMRDYALVLMAARAGLRIGAAIEPAHADLDIQTSTEEIYARIPSILAHVSGWSR